MKKNPFLILALIVVAISVSVLGRRHFLKRSEILEFQNVVQYKLNLNQRTQIPEKISGLCSNSGYCVSKITTKTNGSNLVIFVMVGFCNEGESGSFSYPLEIGSEIKELKFGTEEYSLWKRD